MGLILVFKFTANFTLPYNCFKGLTILSSRTSIKMQSIEIKIGNLIFHDMQKCVSRLFKRISLHKFPVYLINLSESTYGVCSPGNFIKLDFEIRVNTKDKSSGQTFNRLIFGTKMSVFKYLRIPAVWWSIKIQIFQYLS